MSLSIGESVVSARYESEVILSSDLLQLSQTVQMVCSEATNGYVLSGMVLGPLAGIALKCKSLSLFSHFFKDSKIASFAFKPLASGIGLLGEGGIIHFTPALLQTGSFGPNAWNGSLSSTLTIMACKMTARFGLPPNVVMNHMVQNCAIMGAQEVSGILGLSERVHGNWMMRFSEAEVSNIQISAGMSIVHGTTHGIRYMEATFQVQTTVRGSFNLFQGIRNLFYPAKQAITDNGMLAAVPEVVREEIQAKQARDRAAGLRMAGNEEGGEGKTNGIEELAQMIEKNTGNAVDQDALRRSLVINNDSIIIHHEPAPNAPIVLSWEDLTVMIPSSLTLADTAVRLLPLVVRSTFGGELYIIKDCETPYAVVERIIPAEEKENYTPFRSVEAQPDGPQVHIYEVPTRHFTGAKQDHILIAFGRSFSSVPQVAYLPTTRFAEISRTRTQYFIKQAKSLLEVAESIREEDQLMHPIRLMQARRALEMAASLSDPKVIDESPISVRYRELLKAYSIHSRSSEVTVDEGSGVAKFKINPETEQHKIYGNTIGGKREVRAGYASPLLLGFSGLLPGIDAVGAKYGVSLPPAEVFDRAENPAEVLKTSKIPIQGKVVITVNRPCPIERGVIPLQVSHKTTPPPEKITEKKKLRTINVVGDAIDLDGETPYVTSKIDLWVASGEMKGERRKVIKTTEDLEGYKRHLLVLEVTQEHRDQVGGITLDHNAAHFSEMAGRAMGFNGEILHGVRTMGLLYDALNENHDRSVELPHQAEFDPTGIVEMGDMLSCYTRQTAPGKFEGFVVRDNPARGIKNEVVMTLTLTEKALATTSSAPTLGNSAGVIELALAAGGPAALESLIPPSPAAAAPHHDSEVVGRIAAAFGSTGTPAQVQPLSKEGVAFFFPGQGSQVLGMGDSFSTPLDTRRDYRPIMNEAHAAVPTLEAVIGTNPQRLDSPSYAEPALMAFGLGAAHLLNRRGVFATVVSGYGIGEIITLAAIGLIPVRAAITLAHRHGLFVGEWIEKGDKVRSPEERIASELGFYLPNEDRALPVPLVLNGRTMETFRDARTTLLGPGDRRLSLQGFTPNNFELTAGTLLAAGVTHFIDFRPGQASIMEQALRKMGAGDNIHIFGVSGPEDVRRVVTHFKSRGLLQERRKSLIQFAEQAAPKSVEISFDGFPVSSSPRRVALDSSDVLSPGAGSSRPAFEGLVPKITGGDAEPVRPEALAPQELVRRVVDPSREVSFDGLPASSSPQRGVSDSFTEFPGAGSSRPVFDESLSPRITGGDAEPVRLEALAPEERVRRVLSTDPLSETLTPQVEGMPPTGLVSLARYDDIPTTLTGIIEDLSAIASTIQPRRVFDAVDADVAAGIARIKEGLLEAAELFDEVRRSVHRETGKEFNPVVALGPNGGILKRLLEQMIVGGKKNIVLWYYSNEKAIKDNAAVLAREVPATAPKRLLDARALAEGRMNVARTELENLYALIELCKIMGVRASCINESGFIIDSESNIPEAERADTLPLPLDVQHLIKSVSPVEIPGLENERIRPLPSGLIRVVNEARAWGEAETGRPVSVSFYNGATGSKDMNAGPSAPEAVALIMKTDEGPRIELHPVKRQDPKDMLITVRIMGCLQDALHSRFVEQPGWIGPDSDVVSFTWSAIQRRKLGPYFPKYGPDSTLGVGKSVVEGTAEIRQRESQRNGWKYGNVLILGYPYVVTPSSDNIDRAGIETLQGIMLANGEIVHPSILGANSVISIESGRSSPIDTPALKHVDGIELVGLDLVAHQLQILNTEAMLLRTGKYPEHDLRKPLIFTVEESTAILANVRFKR